MTLSDYQKEVDKLLQAYEKPYWQPLSQFARLAEEVGELGRILNHKYGDKVKKPTEEPDNMPDELGDIIFNMICMANAHNIDLDEALQGVINKLRTRDKNRFKKK